ncbi:unnamed protein product, partial [marine sediment metagenome]
MNKLMIGKVIIIFFLSFLLISCKSPGEQEEVKEERYGLSPVKVFQVKKQKISEKLFFTGLIKAWKEINITPDIGGKIAKIHVEE